ncbi:YceD family protein [Brevundimonas diminuta]|uniref:YceD family protein n=1 Tax=Brevundimonas diminuta TaxID=293 RepID=UPI003209ECD6
MTIPALPFSDPVRLHQIGASLSRRLELDEAARARVARALDLKALDLFTAELDVVATVSGWRLTGRVIADAVQSCVLTLEPLPVHVDARFEVNLIEAAEVMTSEDGEIDLELDDDSPDVAENGQIDLGQYAVEQLALQLDPYPRKDGAVFEQPPEPGEISPFGVLRALKQGDSDKS